MPNIEIKARYPDPEKARAIAKKLNARHVGTDHQIDTYYRTKAGRLKLRQSSLGGAELIPYLRPDQPGPKKSEYMIIPVSDPAGCHSLLSRILEVEVVVDKTRDIFLVENVRVHVDLVEGLGNFFEFEAVYENPSDEPGERTKVDRLLKAFEIEPDDLLNGSYREMALKHLAMLEL